MPLLFCINLSKYFQGELSFASTGDLLEFQDSDSGEIYYGILVKNLTLMVYIYVPEDGRFTLVDFSYNINGLRLTRVFINAVGEI